MEFFTFRRGWLNLCQDVSENGVSERKCWKVRDKLKETVKMNGPMSRFSTN